MATSNEDYVVVIYLKSVDGIENWDDGEVECDEIGVEEVRPIHFAVGQELAAMIAVGESAIDVA